jgi:hypothetical protein
MEIITVAPRMYVFQVKAAPTFVYITTLLIRIKVVVTAEVATVATGFTFWAGYHFIVL